MMHLFPKINIDMAIQLKVLSMHKLKGLLYVLQHISEKALINMLFLIKIPKRNNLKVSRIRENLVILLVDGDQAGSFAPAKSLFILVP